MASSEVTQLLDAIGGGDESGYDRLIPLIYDELRQLARSHLERERTGHSLQPTELVNEAYVRLAGGDAKWENRPHFFGAAARAMRHVLVEHARKKGAQKRGGDAKRVTFGDLAIETDDPDVDLLALDEALTALGEVDERLSQVVHLRYFTGLSIDETAQLLSVSPATVKRDWTYARAWLYSHMAD